MLKWKAQPQIKLIIEILKCNALIGHDNTVDVLKDVSDVLLIVFIYLSTHPVNSFSTIVSQLICYVSLAAL